MNEWNRLVVKVGTSTVCHKNGAPNLYRLDLLCRTLSDIKNMGKEVVLVTSGAIGVGVNKLHLPERPKEISRRQATASIGQSELMRIYDRFLNDYGSIGGQILLTKDITENSIAKANVIATFNALLAMGAIPIVNENDSVATEEIVYGDNDTLSAVVASFTKADILILLTDIDGLYDKDPSCHPDATLIEMVTDISAVESLASGSHTNQGTGGMITKIHAAKIANAEGIDMIVASGKDPRILYDLLNGVPHGTMFQARR